MSGTALAVSHFYSFPSVYVCAHVCADLDSQTRVLGSGSKKVGVTSAVSDESVAGDSGVYEAAEKRFVIKTQMHSNRRLGYSA